MKIKREKLNARKNYWRSQIDFQNGFFDNPEKETKNNVNAFVKFFRKYDSYTDIRNIISERNRFDFIDYKEGIGRSFLIRHAIKSYLMPKQVREIERILEDRKEKIDEEKYHKMLEENFGPFVKVYFPKVYFSIDKDCNPQVDVDKFPFKVWKMDNKNPTSGIGKTSMVLH